MARQTSGLTKFFDIEESVVDAGTRFLGAKSKLLYDWWVANAGGGMPLRRMFDIVDHKALVSNIFLVEVTADGNFSFRLFGEEVIHMIGRNRTGEVVRSGAVGEYGHALYEYYRSIIAAKTCRRCVGSLAFADRPSTRFESVDCPLADDGQRVVSIIGVMEILKT